MRPTKSHMSYMSPLKRAMCSTLGLTIVAGAVALAPQPAQANAGTLTNLGVKVIDAVLSWGVGTGLDAAFDHNEAVTLSQASFDQIGTILADLIAEAFFTDYSASATTAYQLADLYVCDPADLDLCWSQAINVHTHVVTSVNQLDTVGIQAAPMLAMMVSIELAFLHKMYQVTTQMGDKQIHADNYESEIGSFAATRVASLKGLQDEWETIISEREGVYWRDAGEYYDGWVTHKDKRACYREFEGAEECSPTKWDCECGWWEDCSVFGAGWDCDDSSPEENWAEQALAQHYEETREDLLGSDFEEIIDEVEFLATGEWTEGTSVELFCDEFDGKTIAFNMPGTPVYMGFEPLADRLIPFPGLLPQGSFIAECQNNDTSVAFQTFDGLYLRAGTSGQNWFINSQTYIDSHERWIPWLQQDGTWAIRSYYKRYISSFGVQSTYITATDTFDVIALD